MEAAQPENEINESTTIFILRTQYNESSNSDSNYLSFTRTRSEWKESKKLRLFEKHKTDSGNITKEAFIRVGLLVLFKDSKNFIFILVRN